MRGSNFTNLHCTNTVILSAIWCPECSMVVSLVFLRFYNDQESIATSTRVFRAAKLKNAQTGCSESGNGEDCNGFVTICEEIHFEFKQV